MGLDSIKNNNEDIKSNKLDNNKNNISYSYGISETFSKQIEIEEKKDKQDADAMLQKELFNQETPIAERIYIGGFPEEEAQKDLRNAGISNVERVDIGNNGRIELISGNGEIGGDLGKISPELKGLSEITDIEFGDGMVKRLSSKQGIKGDLSIFNKKLKNTKDIRSLFQEDGEIYIEFLNGTGDIGNIDKKLVGINNIANLTIKGDNLIGVEAPGMDVLLGDLSFFSQILAGINNVGNININEQGTISLASFRGGYLNTTNNEIFNGLEGEKVKTINIFSDESIEATIKQDNGTQKIMRKKNKKKKWKTID